MIWFFILFLITILVILRGINRRIAIALSLVSLLCIAALLTYTQWGNLGLGL